MGTPFKPYKLKFSTTDALILGAAVLFFPLAMVLAAHPNDGHPSAKQLQGKKLQALGLGIANYVYGS